MALPVIAPALRATRPKVTFGRRRIFGCRRSASERILVNADEETDRRYTEAVVRAVELGVNVIDTAANYRFQRSERSIGAALTELQARGFARDELVICTKGGYLPFDGAPPRDVRQYVEDNFIKTGIAALG